MKYEIPDFVLSMICSVWHIFDIQMYLTNNIQYFSLSIVNPKTTRDSRVLSWRYNIGQTSIWGILARLLSEVFWWDFYLRYSGETSIWGILTVCRIVCRLIFFINLFYFAKKVLCFFWKFYSSLLNNLITELFIKFRIDVNPLLVPKTVLRGLWETVFLLHTSKNKIFSPVFLFVS